MFSRVITYLAAAVALSAGVCVTSAIASEFGPMPANYESEAEAYVSQRLTEPRAARIEMASEPYQVLVDLKGHEALPCWAVDMRVQSRLYGGGFSRYAPMTVLFYKGQAVALKEDAGRVARAEAGERVAGLN